jgi:hypothetical protein
VHAVWVIRADGGVVARADRRCHIDDETHFGAMPADDGVAARYGGARVCAPIDHESPPSVAQAASVETLFAERIAVRLEALGYRSVGEFLAMRPTTSLDAMAATLGLTEVTSFHLERQLLAEALRDGRGDDAARDLLVRLLHEHLPGGWPAAARSDDDAGPDAPWQCQVVAARWALAVGAAPGWRDRAARVALAIERGTAFPIGWLPRGVDDPILVEHFARHWG